MMEPATWLAMVTSGWSEMSQTAFCVALLLRIVFTVFVAALMLLPWLKIVGGLALFYIAAKLLVPDDPDEDETEAAEHLWRAVQIVAIADIIMSLDNVIAIAAAARGRCRADHGAARPLSDSGVGRRRAARLDRRRGHRHRSGDPRLPRAPA